MFLLTGYEPGLTTAYINHLSLFKRYTLYFPSFPIIIMYISNLPLYSFGTILTINDKQIQILKFKSIENYCLWSIYVQTTLKSKAYWNIVTSTRKSLSTSKTNASDNIKKEHREYTQSYSTIKSIQVLNINLSISTNNCTKNSAQQI